MNFSIAAVRKHAWWALCVVLLDAGAAHAQTVRVVAANSSNNDVYEVAFSGSGGSVTTIINDQSTHASLRSVAFLANAETLTVDVLAADTLRDQVLRFPNPTASTPTAAQVVWAPGDGVAGPNPLGLPGPVAPNGLSLDAEQNLFVVSSAPGTSVSQTMWVFKRNPASPSGFDLPRLLDSHFGGASVDQLQETLVSTIKVGPVAFDDLLVAATPARVFRYSAAAIRTVLADGGEIEPSTLVTPTVLGAYEPAGLDFWPTDGKLLISTSNGTVLTYDVEAGTLLANFASGLGNGKFKIKTGLELGQPRAYVANRNGGEILKFGPPAGGANPPLAMVTTGVQSPQGLTVTNAGLSTAESCLASSGGCDPIGVINHQIRDTFTGVAGSLLETACIVQTDPRVDPATGVCDGSPLNLADVCPGFESVMIPGHLCGAAGTPKKAAFAVLEAYAPFIELRDGLFVSEAFPETILPAPIVKCPSTVMAWAPIPSYEAPSVVGDRFEELTGACGSSTTFTRRGSYFLVTSFNVGALPGTTTADKLVQFAASKYEHIYQVLGVAAIAPKVARSLSNCLDQSKRQFDRGDYPNAVGQLLSCDGIVATNAGAFTSTMFVPNPAGEIRGRIANLYLTIDARILGHTPPADWPPL